MLSNSDLLRLRKDTKPVLNGPGVVDIILFGSAAKGKAAPRDLDLAVIVEARSARLDALLAERLGEYHVSTLTLKELVAAPPTLAATLLREGWSLREGRQFCARYRFTPCALYAYDLSALPNAKKASAVRWLRGGFVKEQGGSWLAKSVILVPAGHDAPLEAYFRNNAIAYTKRYVLID